MCMCTEYSASTCGHSWISLTHACGPFRNLLTCHCLETFQVLTAPAFTCPQCHAGFQNEETLRMIADGWAAPAMVAGGMGGRGFLGGWGGSGEMIPHYARGTGAPMRVVGGSCARPQIMPMVSGSGCAGGGVVVPVASGGGCGVADAMAMAAGGWSGRRAGWFGSSGRRRNRRHHYESHHYSESSPTGCSVM